MIKVTFLEHDGTERSVEARLGNTLMQVAAINSIPGIEADCGGACSCATCHVFIVENWTGIVGEANPTENAMLGLVSGRKDNSRLSCQVVLTEAMDGLVVATPETQY